MSWGLDALRSRIDQERHRFDELESSVTAKADAIVRQGRADARGATQAVTRDASEVVQTGAAYARDLADAVKNASPPPTAKTKPLAANAVAHLSLRNETAATSDDERPDNAATPGLTVRERLAPVGAFLQGTGVGLITGALGPAGALIDHAVDADVQRNSSADESRWFGVGQALAGAFHIAHGVEMATTGGIAEVASVGAATPIAVPVAAVGALEITGGVGILAEGLGLATSGAAGTARAPERTPRSIDEDHIFKGEISRRPGGGGVRATGFHHEGEAAAGNARVVEGTKTKPDKLGVYKATVEVKDPVTGGWIRKTARSTFFPQDWDRSQVRAAIREAYASRIVEDGGRWYGKTSSGMTIEGYTDEGGNIITAYPKD